MPDSLTNLAITQFGQVMLLVALAALLHRLLADRAPRLMLTVWTLVAVKAVTPPLLASRLSLFSWVQAPALSPDSSLKTLPTVAWVGPTGLSSQVLGVLAAVWTLGVIVTAVIAWRRWRELSGLLERDALRSEDPLVRYACGLAERYGLRKPDRVVVSTDELGPAVAGLWKPTVILPASFIKDRDPATLRPVLLHELVHLTRRDTVAAVLHTAVRVVWWFNPIMWWAARQAESLVERCVDLTVTRDLQTGVLEYGRGLFRVLELRAELQPQTELASLRPCQITSERLTFLREACESLTPRRDRLGPWTRRLAFIGLSVALLPALPTDALSPHCDDATANYVCEHAVAADPSHPDHAG